MSVIAITRNSGVDYLHAVFDAWRNRAVFVQKDGVTGAADLAALGLHVDHIVDPAGTGGWFSDEFIPDMSADHAQIVFTSGTTGVPKPLVLSRCAISDVTNRLVQIMTMDASIREYIAIPVTYSFGLGRARAIAAVGGRAFLPSKGFRPEEFAAMLASGDVNALSVVPTMIRAMMARPSLFIAGAKNLRWMEIGSQYMRADEKAAVAALFPNACIVQHYGLTEASRSTFLTIQNCPAADLESVGSPIGLTEVKIFPEGHIGIRGPHVAEGLFVDGTVVPVTDKDGWLHTSDLGHFENGLLYFEGRNDDVANISGIKVSAEHFEQQLARSSGLEPTNWSVTACSDPLRGQILVLAIEANADEQSLEAALRATAAGHKLGAADIIQVRVAEIPRTETGKVQRKKLAEMCALPIINSASAPPRENRGTISGDASPATQEAEIAQLWRNVLGVKQVSRDDNFYDLGGDSLSAISAMLRAESYGMSASAIEQMLDGHTIAEIAAAASQPTTAAIPKRSGIAVIGETTNALRGVLVLLVIAAHWGPFIFERLGSFGTTMAAYVQPVTRMGTPGFAMVFGLGVAFFYLNMFQRSPERLRAKLRTNGVLISGGLLLLGGVRALQLSVTQGLDWRWPTLLFYDVLVFYALATVLIRPLLAVITLTKHTIINTIAVGLAALFLLTAAQEIWSQTPQNGVEQLFRLMLTAQYSVPQMMIAVTMGLALGIWIRSHQDDLSLNRMLFRVGICLLIVGFLMVLVLQANGWQNTAGHPVSFTMYLGAITIGFAVLLTSVQLGNASRLIRLFATIGMLAFPAFVTHQMVGPIKDLLVVAGIPYMWAMAASVGAFFVAAVLAIRWLGAKYFGDRSTANDA